MALQGRTTSERCIRAGTCCRSSKRIKYHSDCIHEPICAPHKHRSRFGGWPISSSPSALQPAHQGTPCPFRALQSAALPPLFPLSPLPHISLLLPRRVSALVVVVAMCVCGQQLQRVVPAGLVLPVQQQQRQQRRGQEQPVEPPGEEAGIVVVVRGVAQGSMQVGKWCTRIEGVAG